MHKDGFYRQWARIETNYGKTAKELEGLAQQVWSKYSTLDESVFVRMVSWILDNSKYAPRLAHFNDAQKAIQGTVQYNTSTARDRCEACDGTGFNIVYYLVRFKHDPEDREPTPYSGARPCRKCNANAPIRESRVIHVRDITEQEYEAHFERKREAPTVQSSPLQAKRTVQPLAEAAKNAVKRMMSEAHEDAPDVKYPF